jgi:hypothetical protein
MVRNLKHTVAVLAMLSAFMPAVFSQTPTEKPSAEAEQKRADTAILEDAKSAILENIPVISLDENDNQDGSAQNVSSQLTAGRNPFFNAASFHFNAVRFRFRGYDADAFSTMMNGVPMENLDNGFTPFALWGGLNDVVRNRDATVGLRPTPYAFGDFGGMTYLDTRASKQRKQTSINYAASNRSYDNRIMITHSTGLNKKGWAFSLSGSRRWADEGYVPGTYYNGWSAYVGVDKRINSRHLLSLVGFFAPTENGRQGAAVDEMRTLSNDVYYNPYWGYQNGKKRNASVAKLNQPVFILTHEWKINDKINLTTAGSYLFGNRSVSGIDWYNAPDPRPDYYRYLPSYYADNPNIQAEVTDAFISNVNLRQINWDKLYNVNYASNETVRNADGIAGNDVTGKRSKYIVEDRNIYTNRYNFNTVLNSSVSQHVDLSAGASYQYQKNHYYKSVNDLLGGDFYVDLNQFAERDYPGSSTASQNDLNAANRILKVDDEFGYNYAMTIAKATAWSQAQFKFNRFDFFVAAEYTYNSFYRTGYAKVGLFPDNSYGKSKKYTFNNYALKGGGTYKLDGRNYFYANGAYLTRAPFFDNAFVAPRTRDLVQDNLKSEEVTTAEAGYVLNSPNIKFRATGFYTGVKNQLNVMTFYHDQYRNFVNYALSNIGKQHFGTEIGVEAKLGMGFSFNAAANIARYYYNTRQKATVTVDNSAEIVAKDITIYSENFRLPTPQECYTAGLEYRSKSFWFINANVNYFRKMWLDFNPLRRTAAAVDGLDPKSELYESIINQTQLDDQYTVDVFAGYSWKVNNKFKSLKRNTFLVFNLGVNNLLNNKKIISGGFEQLRFDFDGRDINKFPPKYFYSYGLTFYASVGLRF